MKLRSWQALALVAAGVAVGWLLPRVGEAVGEPVDRDLVAVVGSAQVTMEDVERNAPKEFEQFARQEYELIDQYLERAIQIKVIELEAEARGMSPAELVQQEVDDQLAEPTEEEVSTFYEERRLQGQGSKEEMVPQIRSYLTQERRNEQYGAFLVSLRDRHPVERVLEPPRTEVAADGFPTKGGKDAPVTIVEFADFQCPFCFQIIRTLDQVEEAYGEKVRMVYRQLPLPELHPDAQKSAEASLCADEQDKFWEMHDAMFADQRALSVDDLKETARSLGLDARRFGICLDSD